MLQRQAPPAAPPANAQATAEAEAVQTVGLLRDSHRLMLASPEQRIRNTAQMMDAPGERSSGHRVRATPMTVRSDSAQLVADRGDNAATTTYYFYGTQQDNEHKFGPGTLGTIEGDGTIVIRGKDSSGAMRTHDDIIGTLVHETSHIIVADYGEHPGNQDRRRVVRPLPGRVPRVLRRAQRPVHRARARRPRGRDPQSHVWRERRRRHLRRPRQRLLGAPLATNQFRAQVLAHTARMASTSTTAPISTASCTCCATTRPAARPSRRRCSRSPCSPPPSAPRPRERP